MTEHEFWIRLEFRVCAEFAGMTDNHLRHYWCDGFCPQQYRLDAPQPCIVGQSWIGSAPRADEWEFTLFLNQSYASRAEIDWASLLPSDNVTQWMALDMAAKRIQIEPAAAVPDPRDPVPGRR
jgi:hypothetical protein